MNKIIASFTLASLAMACAACDERQANATTADMAAPAYSPAAVEYPAPATEEEIQWELMDDNKTGRYFMDQEARKRASFFEDNWAIIRIEYHEPVGSVRSLEAMIDFNCEQGLQRNLVADTFDAQGNLLDHDDRYTPWQRPAKGTIGEGWQKWACTPFRDRDG